MKIERWPTADNPTMCAIAQNESDLYLLSRLIKVGDIVIAKTDRKVQTVEGKQQERKVFTLGIKVTNTSYKQMDGELTMTGKTVTENDNVQMGAMHSIHLPCFKKVTVTKPAWSQEEIDDLQNSQDISRNAQKAVIQMGRDGIARFAYVDEEEIMGFTRLQTQIPQKTAFNQNKISQAQGKFFSEVVKLLKGKLDAVPTIKDLGIFAQQDVLTSFKNFVDEISPPPFSGVSIKYDVSKETALSRVLGQVEGDQAAAVFEQFHARLEQNQRYYVGPDAVKCLEQQPHAFSHLLILKSLQTGVDRDVVSDFLEKIRSKKLHDIDVRLVSDRCELGQQLKNYGGIVGLLKYEVFLENVEQHEGQEFQAWDTFDEIAE